VSRYAKSEKVSMDGNIDMIRNPKAFAQSALSPMKIITDMYIIASRVYNIIIATFDEHKKNAVHEEDPISTVTDG
jgi:hypothetical protein